MDEAVFAHCADPHGCALWRLLETTRELAAPIKLEQILQKAIASALQVLDAERGSVFLYDARTHELYTKVSTGIDDGDAPPPEGGGRLDPETRSVRHDVRFSADKGIAGETIRGRQLINVPDCYADPRFNTEVDRSTGYVTRCLLSIPLLGIDNAQVGVLQVLNKRNGTFNHEDEQIAVTLAAHCAVALQRATLLQEHLVKQKMEQDLALAREIQLGALPKELPILGGYEMLAWSNPAEQTGGDIYDAVSLDSHRAGLLVADATGHGIGPALSVTQLRAMFRMGLSFEEALGDVLYRINLRLKADLPPERFITAFAGILDSHKHKIIYHSWGQGPMLHYHAGSDQIEWITASTLPMGILADPPMVPPPPRAMDPGDIFAVISDGFFEYSNQADEQFGWKRIGEIIQTCRRAPLDQIRKSLQASLQTFAQGAPQEDDMTILMVRRREA